MKRFVLLYLGDVEATPDPMDFSSLEEAMIEVKKWDKAYTPPHAYWVIYEVVEEHRGEFTKKRY